MELVKGTNYTKKLLTELIGTGNLLDPATLEVRLFKNDVDVDEDTVLADLEEADFSGYSAVAPEWNGPYEDQTDNLVDLLAGSATFATGATVTTPNNVYGVMLVGGVGATEFLVGAARFPAVIGMTTPGQLIQTSVRYNGEFGVEY